MPINDDYECYEFASREEERGRERQRALSFSLTVCETATRLLESAQAGARHVDKQRRCIRLDDNAPVSACNTRTSSFISLPSVNILFVSLRQCCSVFQKQNILSQYDDRMLSQASHVCRCYICKCNKKLSYRRDSARCGCRSPQLTDVR